MCGIAGWFSVLPTSSNDRATLQSMSNAIVHRGPDAQSVETIDCARFAHVRLSIIDLDSGHQPFHSQSGNITLIFNGEIYNYEQLRDGLLRQGVTMRTHSDTEVIAELIDLEGIQCVSKFRGMFAFAVWDGRSKTGYLVRDSQGIKPLFTAVSPKGELYFASEAKAILGARPGYARLNEKALHHVMNFRYLPGQFSLFDGVSQLKPGEILTWTSDSMKTSSFTPTYAPFESLSDAIEDSFTAHLVADVPIATYLSGGVDSALVTSFAAAHSTDTIHSYTLSIGDDPLESQNARETAQHIGVTHHIHDPAPISRESFRRLIWHLEVPKVNAYQSHQLASLVSGKQKVVLSGLGADELFTGYNIHEIVCWAERFRPLSGLAGLVSSPLKLLLGRLESADMWSEKSRAIDMLALSHDLPFVYAQIRNVWDSPKLREQIYGPRMLDQKLDSSLNYIRENMPSEGSYLERVLRYETQEKLVNDLLWQEDRCGMSQGIEVRVPFVDAPLASHLKSYSAMDLMPKRQKKFLLKQYASKALPANVLSRPKSGFQVDSSAFFNDYLSDLADTYLSEEYVKKMGLFNPDFIASIRALPAKKKYRWHYFMLYMMLGAHVWLEMFEAPEPSGQWKN